MSNILIYLHRHGHSHVTLLSGAKKSSRFYRRLEQAAQASTPDGVTLQVIHTLPGFSIDALRQAQKSTPKPTAVIAADVERTQMLYAGLRAVGTRVPEDVSIVSFFDHQSLTALAPPVTATTAGGQALAERAVERLLQKINVPETIPHHVFVPGEVIERDSVQNCHKSKNRI